MATGRPAPAARILQGKCNRFSVLEDPPGQRNAISLSGGLLAIVQSLFGAGS
jgi:hypothetical protein